MEKLPKAAKVAASIHYISLGHWLNPISCTGLVILHLVSNTGDLYGGQLLRNPAVRGPVCT